MNREKEIWALANQLIENRGAKAGRYAARRALDLAEEHDHEGKRMWLRLLEAIKFLQAKDKPKTKH